MRANSGEVLISATIRDLVAGSEIRCEDRGAISAPGGDSGSVQLLSVNLPEATTAEQIFF
ncbi:MAG TPA: hypothetical protein VMH28_32535 [Candidatus Acidoferrales bacterium]|nr:hypothetical protein [Candidatus Acidoferrales bacterium]